MEMHKVRFIDIDNRYIIKESRVDTYVNLPFLPRIGEVICLDYEHFEVINIIYNIVYCKLESVEVIIKCIETTEWIAIKKGSFLDK